MAIKEAVMIALTLIVIMAIGAGVLFVIEVAYGII
jgi:hypothetical protein